MLCGSEHAVFTTARSLYRRYGITSYALIPERTRRGGLFMRILTAPLVKILRTPCHSPVLLTETALRFFEGTDGSTALPVLIDCTDGSVLLSDPVLRDRLESRVFLSDPNHLSEIPPFCYLNLGGTPHDF